MTAFHPLSVMTGDKLVCRCARQSPGMEDVYEIAETIHRSPAGSTPARQRCSPPAGSECCMAYGNVRREAYTAGGEAALLSLDITQCRAPSVSSSWGQNLLCHHGEARKGRPGSLERRKATGWTARKPGRTCILHLESTVEGAPVQSPGPATGLRSPGARERTTTRQATEVVPAGESISRRDGMQVVLAP